MSETIRLLPHHLLCIHGFRGKGYSPEFIQNMATVIRNLTDITAIEITQEADPICLVCPHLNKKSAHCNENRKVREIDRRALDALHFKIGERTTWGEICKRIAETAPDLDTICHGCEWRSLGNCINGITALRQTRGFAECYFSNSAHLEKIEALISSRRANRRSNFAIAFWFLNRDKRNAIETVYAFARLADDIVDNDEWSDDEKNATLSAFEQALSVALARKKDDESPARIPPKLNALFREVREVRRRFNIREKHFFDLIHGCRLDLHKNTYETFDELKDYCYHVASTIGLMCISIFDYSTFAGMKFAINLGLSFQLINIIRDLREDYERGRVYIPNEDLRRFHISSEHILEDPNLGALLREYAARARSYHSLAFNEVTKQDLLGPLFPANLMAHVYLRLLSKIENRPPQERISLGKLEKLLAITKPIYQKFCARRAR